VTDEGAPPALVSPSPSPAPNAKKVKVGVVPYSAAEVAAYYEKHQLTLHGKDSDINPLRTFAEAGFSSDVMQCTRGFDAPTPIQAQCWPILARGRDVVGVAKTGSGKTLAFTLPVFEKIRNGDISQGPLSLIVAPTRELAIQIHEVCVEAGASCGIKSVCCYGQSSKRDQITALNAGVHVVVGTPGRLWDLTESGYLILSHCQYLTLDEADRMLDKGFEKVICDLAGSCKKVGVRKTLMFSATWPQEVKRLANTLVHNPVRVSVGSEDLTANTSITQYVDIVKASHKDRRAFESEKVARLDKLLKKYHTGKNRIIVFALYKKEASRLEQTLVRKGYNARGIHGDKSQVDRIAALQAFKAGTTPILVATDVAARGLDIPNVEYVINFAFPLTIEDYVHRIGRTGRAGKKGVSHTLFSDFDKHLGGALMRVLKDAGQEVPESLKTMGVFSKKKKHAMYGDHFKKFDGPVPKATLIKF